MTMDAKRKRAVIEAYVERWDRLDAERKATCARVRAVLAIPIEERRIRIAEAVEVHKHGGSREEYLASLQAVSTGLIIEKSEGRQCEK